MKIEQNKEKQEEQAPEITQEQIEEFAFRFFVHTYKNNWTAILKYINEKNISINDAVNEVLNKQSGLSRKNRDLLESTKLEILEKIFNTNETN